MIKHWSYQTNKGSNSKSLIMHTKLSKRVLYRLQIQIFICKIKIVDCFLNTQSHYET